MKILFRKSLPLITTLIEISRSTRRMDRTNLLGSHFTLWRLRSCPHSRTPCPIHESREGRAWRCCTVIEFCYKPTFFRLRLTVHCILENNACELITLIWELGNFESPFLIDITSPAQATGFLVGPAYMRARLAIFDHPLKLWPVSKSNL